jgi:hypothetical protein
MHDVSYMGPITARPDREDGRKEAGRQNMFYFRRNTRSSRKN